MGYVWWLAINIVLLYDLFQGLVEFQTSVKKQSVVVSDSDSEDEYCPIRTPAAARSQGQYPETDARGRAVQLWLHMVVHI